MFDALVDAAGLAGGLGALLVLGKTARIWWGRTLGRRRDRFRRIARLGTNAQLSFFAAVLGEPPAFRRTVVSETPSRDAKGQEVVVVRHFEECVFIDRDFFVQCLLDTDQTVLAFSVTTRTKRFAPRFDSPAGHVVQRRGLIRKLGARERFVPVFSVRLGRTRFSALDTPERVRACLRAHDFKYHEAHWLGNPGNYQWYVFGVNDVGVAWEEAASAFSLLSPNSMEVAWDNQIGGPDLQDLAEIATFRGSVTLNTLTIIGPALDLGDYPDDLAYGPDIYHVRTLP